MTMLQTAVAAAPASIGNVGVGFDILGLAFGAAHDEVVAGRDGERGVRLGAVSGTADGLPDGVENNSALAAAAALLEAAGHPFGVTLSVRKGIPVAAGMGGSAASAVAAAAAVNALLPRPFETRELLPFALAGERISADPPHWDNVMASLIGGMVLAARADPPYIHQLPVPAGITVVLLHPDVRTETRAARALLAADVPMSIVVEHSRRIAAFMAGCVEGDLRLIKVGLEDLLIEPQRAHLLPPFAAVQTAALQAGALGCSYSGSGPSMFAWVPDDSADGVEQAMAAAFAEAGVSATAYRAPLFSPGVRVEPARAAA